MDTNSKRLFGSGFYAWHQQCERERKRLDECLDAVLAEVSAAGLEAWEAHLPAPEQCARLGDLVAKHSLAIPTVYTGGRLHDSDWRRTCDDILARAASVRALGTRIVVCNPDPIAWGSPEAKNDRQLAQQADALIELTRGLRAMGMTLAYHTHDSEFRCPAAREFHHMMCATEASGMGFCLDTHWVFQSAGYSNLALLDVIRLYGKRIVSLHLRQSVEHVWYELLGEGDLDYAPVFAALTQLKLAIPTLLELCDQPTTVRTMTLTEAHRRSAAWLRSMVG